MNGDTKLPFDPDNDEAVAEWFATHDATELETERVTNVKVRRRREKELEPLTLRIDPEDMKQLKKLAHEAGVGYTTMARMILHRELKKSPKVNV
ncbi:MAG: BrnA antitoxin family protein [Alicyclobacillus sp.]|nr:BrnA antitoxin family protein [Alicyclobacillus sp.]